MTEERRTLVVATRNAGKLREFRRLLAGLDAGIVGLDEVGVVGDVEETGKTLAENARLKAEGYARLCGELVLADDSGLEVDALGGAPGVQSARYGGPGLSDRERARLLLDEMRGVPQSRRSARFRAVLSIAEEGAVPEPTMVEGVLEGVIARQPLGDRGFGYDPVFWVPDKGRTVAQLSPEEKDEISHRGRAARLAMPILRDLLAHRRDP